MIARTSWIVSKKLLRQLESFHSACQDTGEEVMLFKEIAVGRWEQAWFQNVEVAGG